MQLKKTRERFLAFANNECKGNSELYYFLSIEIAKDEDLLQMASLAKEGQPVPNIFLAAIHFLVLKNPRSELAKHYPSITGKPVKEALFLVFKNFCILHETEIKKIISTKIVQTNVINRCAYLAPVFSKIIAEENKPTTLVDIGTSAGLTLNFDQYEYWYNRKKTYGRSKVLIHSKIIDSAVPEIFEINQPVTKIGIDQHIIDPNNEEEILWLKALVWADQTERFTAMTEALKLEELRNIHFEIANSTEDFENIFSKIGIDQNFIMYATHVLYQFSVEQKIEFFNMLDRIGKKRDFYFLSVEGTKDRQERYRSKEMVVELTSYKNGEKTITFLAETNGHANWIKWKW